MTVGAGLTAFTVSNELYVANDETVITAGFLIFAYIVGRAVVSPYTQLGQLDDRAHLGHPEQRAFRAHQGCAEPH